MLYLLVPKDWKVSSVKIRSLACTSILAVFPFVTNPLHSCCCFIILKPHPYFCQGFTEALCFEGSADDALVNHFVNVYMHLTERNNTFLIGSVGSVFPRGATSEDNKPLFHKDHTFRKHFFFQVDLF